MNNQDSKFFVITLGMHRSGTSFLSRALNLSGLNLGPEEDFYDQEFNPKPGNPKGHWENIEINSLNEEILKINGNKWDVLTHPNNKTPEIFGDDAQKILNKFLNVPALGYGFKDPRMTLLLDFWTPFLSKFIISGIFRHPLKVAESLKIRNGFSYEKSLGLWKIYNLNLLENLKKYPGFLIDFDWSEKKLFDEIKTLTNKIGLIDADLSYWFSNESKKSDKSYDKNYLLPLEIKKIYLELKELSLKNSKLNFDTPILKPSHYRDILKQSISSLYASKTHFSDLYSAEIEKLKTEKIILDFHDPIISLLAYYHKRFDLQKIYPEVEHQFDLKNFLTWIINVCENTDTNETEAQSIFLTYLSRFKSFQKSNFSIDELKTIITSKESQISTLEQDKSTLEQDKSTLEQDKSTLEQDKSTLEQDKSTLEQDKSTLEQDKSTLEQDKSTLEQDKSILSNNIFQIKDENKMISLDNFNLHNIINQNQFELSTIKSSWGFKIIRSYGKIIDSIFNPDTKIGRFLLILPVSISILQKEGIKSYIKHVNEKFERKEFGVIKINKSFQANLDSTTIIKNYKPYVSPIKKRDSIKQIFNVSVVIPTNSTINELTPIIEKINFQKGLNTIEIILINSGFSSLNKIANNVEEIKINSEEFNHGKTRNIGINSSHGDYIIVQTDDAIPVSNYLYYDMCNKFSDDSKLAVVSARQIPKINSDLISQFSINKHYFYLDLTEDTIRSSNNFDNLDFQQKRTIAQIDDVCSCYKSEIISKYMFRELNYAEDLDLGIRLIKDGFRICQLFDSAVIHSHTRSSTYHLKRGFVDSFWLYKLLEKDEKNPESIEYDNFSEFSFDVFRMLSSLESSISILKLQKNIKTSETFENLNKLLLQNYHTVSLFNNVEKPLVDFLQNLFDSSSKIQLKQSYLLNHFYNMLNRFENYMKSSNPYIDYESNEFFETLYKLLSSCIGIRFSNYFISMLENDPDKEIVSKKINDLIMGGV